jgi:hypothetical protein
MDRREVLQWAIIIIFFLQAVMHGSVLVIVTLKLILVMRHLRWAKTYIESGNELLQMAKVYAELITGASRDAGQGRHQRQRDARQNRQRY